MRRLQILVLGRRCLMVLAVLTAGLCTISTAAAAQAKVNYDTGTISWDWVKINPVDAKEGVPTEYHVYAGPVTGQYTYQMKPVFVPNKSILIKDLCQSLGPCFLKIFPANTYGEGPGSPEIPLDAGNAPKAAVSNVKVQ